MVFVVLASSLSQSIRRAKKRLASLERSCWHLTVMPLGRCLSWTQLAVLFCFWPPFPPPKMNFSLRSLLEILSAALLWVSSYCFFSDGNDMSALYHAWNAIFLRGFR